MKWIRNIFAVSAAAFAAVACTIESEDTFSKSPVAPVLEAHSDILITEGTKAESVLSHGLMHVRSTRKHISIT